MRRSDLYIVSDRTNAPALALVNDAISGLAASCRADPGQLEYFESGARRAHLVEYGQDRAGSSDWNPISSTTLPLVTSSAGVGLLSHGLRRVLELRLVSDARFPDLIIFASARSFKGITLWIHSLAQFEWGWTSIYLLDDGAESDAKSLLNGLNSGGDSMTGNGRVVSADEFRRLSGDLRSTIDFGWHAELPLTAPAVPPKGSVWVAREGVQIAKAITPEAVRFLFEQQVFRSTDHYWAHGMAAWGVLADYR